MSNSRILSKLTSNLSSNVGKILTVNDSAEITPETNYAWIKSNSAFIAANSAFDSSNTKFSSSGGSISGDVDITGSLVVEANLTVSGTVSGAGFSNYLTSPPAIGSTTPAAGAFTTLSSTGNTALGDAAGDTLTINGTAVSIPNNLNFDSNTLFIDAANNRVGIGTNSPGTTLQVNGGISPATTDANYLGLSSNRYLAVYSRIWSTDNGISGWNIDGNTSPGYDLTWSFNGSEKARFTTAGNVGIGTSSPGEKLNVVGGGQSTSTLNVTGGNGDDNGTIASDYSLVFQVDANNTVGGRDYTWRYGGKGYSDGTMLMNLNSSGNLGLGVTPSVVGGDHKLFEVQGNGNGLLGASASIHLIDNCYWNGSSWVRVDTSAPTYLQLADGVFRFYNGVGGTAGGSFSPNQAMTLDTSGNLGIGYTSLTGLGSNGLAVAGNVGIGTSSPANKLTVDGNANITGNTTLGDASTDTVTVNGYMGVGGAGGSSASVLITNSALTGTSQYGVYTAPTFTSAATTNGWGFRSSPSTAAASFTMSDLYHFRAVNAGLGAGSTITNQHGVYISDQTSAVNNYGITSLVSSGTNKWNIYASGTAANYFAGNVGIGTSSPGEKLNVVGGGQSTSTLNVTGGNGNDNSTIASDYSLVFQVDANNTVGGRDYTWRYGGKGYSDGTMLMNLNSSGNLGLGVTPSVVGGDHKLFEVQGNGNGLLGASASIHLIDNCYWNGSSWVRVDTSAPTYLQLADGVFRFYNGVGGTAGGSFSPNQAMTLTASGKLLVGATSLATGLELYAQIEASGPQGGIVINSSSTGASDYSRIMFTKSNASGNEGLIRYSTYDYHMAFWTDAGERMRITNSGNVLINAYSGSYKLTLNGQPGANGYTAWTNYSDRRLKTNIVEFCPEPVLTKISQLRPVSFNYNELSGYDEQTRARTVSGFIAQEIQEVFPEMVGTFNLDGEEYLDTNLSNLNLYLVRAIQELHAEIESLKAKVN